MGTLAEKKLCIESDFFFNFPHFIYLVKNHLIVVACMKVNTNNDVILKHAVDDDDDDERMNFNVA